MYKLHIILEEQEKVETILNELNVKFDESKSSNNSTVENIFQVFDEL